ncbi:MAG: insulinase family protein [Puniceicoccales bacterium]|nr:insulinase family protein [Puniceicoccales bacterium]
MRKWLLQALLLFLALPPVAAMDEVFFEIGGDVPMDSEAICGVLDNGLHYYILPNREPPGKVSMRLFVGVGSLMEKDSERGLAHFLEHIAFCGSENFSQGDLIEELQRMGMQFGHHTNAYTSFEETVYQLELPKGTRQMVKDGLLVFRDYLTGLSIDQKELARERGVILSEFRHTDSPQYRDLQANYSFLFSGSSIGNRFPIGSEKVVREVTAENMRDFYKRFYVPNASAVVVVGDVDPQMVVKCLRHIMGDIPEGRGIRPTDTGKIRAVGVHAAVYRDEELPQVTVSINAVEPLNLVRDSKELRRRDLYDRVANYVVTRRLERLSKLSKAPFYTGESSTNYGMRNGVRINSLTLTTDGERALEAMGMAEKTLRMALEAEFSPVEVEKAKAAVLKRYADKRDQAKSRRSNQLANKWIRAIGSNRVPTSPEWDYEFAKDVIDVMAAHDVWQAYKNGWATKNRLLYASGNLPRSVGTSSLRAAYTKSQREFSRFDTPLVPETFAYENFGSPGNVASESYDKELDLYCYTFQNGVRLNIKPTKFEAGQVLVRVRFGQGLLTEPRNMEGLTKFAAWSFVDGGLGQHSCDDLSDIFAGKTWGVRFGVGVDASLLTGHTTRDDMDDELRLLAAYIIDPAFSEVGAQEAQKVIAQVYPEMEHTAEGVLGDEGQRFMHNNDPRFGYPDQDVMAAYTMDDVRNWLTEELHDGYMEITIIGDVNVNHAMEEVRKTFGTFKTRSGKPAPTDNRLDMPVGEVADFTFETIIPKGLVQYMWPTGDTWNIIRKRKLDLLADLLQERVRVKIRKELGDSYAPNAGNFASLTFANYGYVYINALVDVEKVDQTADVICELADELVHDEISDDEFWRIKGPALTEIQELLRKNSYWLSAIDGIQAYPIKRDFIKTLAHFYETVQKQDLKDVLKYLDNSKRMLIKIRPQ